MSSSRSLLVVAALAVLAVVGIVLVVTGENDEGSGPFPAENPTKDQLAAVTGLGFPSTVTNYRSVRLDRDQLDVTFELPARDVDALVSDSDLPPLSPTRVIAHSSPLWELNATGEIAATSDSRGGLTINLEAVSGQPTVVRLSVVASEAD